MQVKRREQGSANKTDVRYVRGNNQTEGSAGRQEDQNTSEKEVERNKRQRTKNMHEPKNQHMEQPEYADLSS